MGLGNGTITCITLSFDINVIRDANAVHFRKTALWHMHHTLPTVAARDRLRPTQALWTYCECIKTEHVSLLRRMKCHPFIYPKFSSHNHIHFPVMECMKRKILDCQYPLRRARRSSSTV